MARLRCLGLKILYITASDVPIEEAIGKIFHKPLPWDVLTLEARAALAGGVDCLG